MLPTKDKRQDPLNINAEVFKNGLIGPLADVTHETPDLLKKGENLLIAALATEPTVRTCKDDWGKHDWVTLASDQNYSFCNNCKVPKSIWYGQQNVNVEEGVVNVKETDNTDEKLNKEEVSKPWLFKSGDEWRGNKEGRPKGSRNLTTVVLEYLKNRKFVISDENGKKLTVDGEVALADAIVENAVKNKDRESIRMIWEFADGKPTQQHKIEVNGPRGYHVAPEREKMIHEQFGVYSDRLETPEIDSREAVLVETAEISTEEPKLIAEAISDVKEPITETNTNANINSQPTGVVEAQTSIASGVKEA